VPIIHEFPPLLQIKDILKGATPGAGDPPKRYHCQDADCIDISQVDYNFKGLERMVNETLLGAVLMPERIPSYTSCLATAAR